MRTGKYLAYYRVSTAKQGMSGLGLDGQRKIVRDHLNGGDWSLAGEFTEVEHATRRKGKAKHRPELERALAMCRIMGARLIVAKVDRLTRDPDFVGTLVQAGVEVEFCNMPNVPGAVGTFMLRQMLAVAELEAGMISERTKQALAAAKARGQKLGGDRGNLPAVGDKGRTLSVVTRKANASRRATDLAPIIADIRAAGAKTLQAVADGLNDRGIPTARGGRWSPVQVQRVEARGV